ncbi:MAG TPA: helix-turn-helix domain-containing protein, partial [Polyangiaceae bacterium LLY-WYZ-15_(1-7)]|nr:helix-turn-helix domain-containing protein [Polyangiaceae bacterium LLY-WYZ-15_(1-7)]
MGRSIEAEEAAARLGVKRATLYAYVSRGLLSRTPHPDGRRSLFDADEVEALRARSRRQVRGELGAIVTTRVSRVDETRPRLAGRPLSACLDAGLEDTLARLWGAPLEHPRLPRRLAASIARAARALPPGAAPTDRLGLAL